MSATGRRAASVLFSLAAAIAMLFVLTIPASAHYPGAVIKSKWAATIPSIDGIFGPGEWSDATVLDLQATDPLNELKAYVYFKNWGYYLYVCMDVPGDITEDVQDSSLLSFDTGNDAIYTDGHEAMFAIDFGTTWHYVWDGSISDYVVHCSPFDPALLFHSGLLGAQGFHSSPNGAQAHRIYEYQIPLALVLAVPGDTIGLGINGILYMGILDGSTGRGDQWPFLRWGPLELGEYGDLVLAKPPPVPSLSEWSLGALTLLVGAVLIFGVKRKGLME